MSSNWKKPLLIVDFCNITEWSHKKILNLQRKYRIVHTQAGEKDGFEKLCFPKEAKKKRQFALIDDKDLLDFKKSIEKGLPKTHRPFVILSSEKESQDLFKYLQKSQVLFKDVLRNIPDPVYAVEYANKVLNNLKGSGYKFDNLGKTWSPEFKYGPGYLNSFEDHVDWQIISIFLEKQAGNIFPYIKECERCNSFYIAKILRKDQKYCPKCSLRTGYATIKSKKDLAKYQSARRSRLKSVKMKKEREEAIKKYMKSGYTKEEANEIWEADQKMKTDKFM